MKQNGLKSLLGLLLLCAACSNPSTPAGFEGYVTQGAIFGKARFYETQTGPMSTGLGWLLSTNNVDMRWRTVNEDFQVLSSDNLRLTFQVHAVIRPLPGSVQQQVEKYGAVDSDDIKGGAWYSRVVKEPFRNAVYEAVSGLAALDAKERREDIAKTVDDRLLAYLSDKPFQVQAIVVGTINLPDLVAQAQEQKIKKETELAQKQFEISIAGRDAEVRIAEAKGIAEAQRIINATLTPLYLQHEAIKAQFEMSKSPNHTTVYVPSGSNGIPLIKAIE